MTISAATRALIRLLCGVVLALCMTACASHYVQPPKQPELASWMDELRSFESVDPLAEMELHDELWILDESTLPPPLHDEVRPRSGCMIARSLEGEWLGPLPITNTRVRARIQSAIASVTLERDFLNPYEQRIDAAHLIPLHRGSVIQDVVLELGSRRIRAVIRERSEAERMHARAQSQGYTSVLLRQESTALFQMLATHLSPGQSIRARIRYAHPLLYDRGRFEFRVPLAQRSPFHASASAPVSVSETASVPVDSIGPLRLELSHTAGLGEIESSSHRIQVERQSATRATVVLARESQWDQRNFVLHYQARAAERASLITHEGERGGYFALWLSPNATNAEPNDWSKPQLQVKGIELSQVVRRPFQSPFPSSPQLWLGRYTGTWPTPIRCSLTIKGGQQDFEVLAATISRSTEASPLPTLWASSYLQASMGVESREISSDASRRELLNTALDYGVLSPLTAFGIVDTTSGPPR